MCMLPVREDLPERTFVRHAPTQRRDSPLARQWRNWYHPRDVEGRGFCIPAVDPRVIGCEQPGEVLVELKRVGRIHQPPCDMSRATTPALWFECTTPRAT